MKLSTLVAELNDPRCVWISRSQKATEIYSYELFLPDSKLSPGVVYICDIKQLPGAVPPETSLFCVGTPEDAHIEPGDNNIVTFDGDLMTLLRNVGIHINMEHKLQSDKQILMETLNSGSGLQSLIDIAYGLLQSPIILVDNAYMILATSRAATGDLPDQSRPLQLGQMMDTGVKLMLQERRYEKASRSKYPYYAIEPKTHAGWLTAHIYVFGIDAAQICIMEQHHEFTSYDYELTHFLTQIISLELQKDGFYPHNETLMHSTLMADLLGGSLPDNTVLARIHQLGWTLSSAMHVLTVFDRNYGVFDHNAYVICDKICQMYKNCRWVILENKIVFLLILGEEDDDEARSWMRLRDYLSANKLTASISDRFSELFAVRWKYAQCEAAYNLGQRMNPGAALYFYKDYHVHHIGSVVLKDLPAGVLFHPAVIAMQQYDRENGTEFIATLKEYFREVGDPGAAAKKLFIHKNTLFYRINKAKELFSLELGDGYERLRIYTTLIFLEL